MKDFRKAQMKLALLLEIGAEPKQNSAVIKNAEELQAGVAFCFAKNHLEKFRNLSKAIDKTQFILYNRTCTIQIIKG